MDIINTYNKYSYAGLQEAQAVEPLHMTEVCMEVCIEPHTCMTEVCMEACIEPHTCMPEVCMEVCRTTHMHD